MTGGQAASPLVGILGGGQLGRMMALAGLPLGCRFRFLEPGKDPPARDVGEVIRADFEDAAALERFRHGLAIVTYEFENVPVRSLRKLDPHPPVLPPADALEMTQDRLREKEAFRRLGILTAPFHPVERRSDLEEGLRRLGLPAILKTRRMGYDGKGQWPLIRESDVAKVWETAGGVPLLLEGWVSFRRELSIVAARGKGGETAYYPLAENEHQGGILVSSRAPVTGLAPGVQEEAESIAERILEDLAYVGVIAIELFDTEGGLLANELAPRVHNSGHWTQNGAATSQFENHLRAVLGMPLGSPEPLGWSAMVNLLGALPDPARVLAIPGAHLHLYGKHPRPGRKVGHINVRGSTPEELERKLALLSEVLEGG